MSASLNFLTQVCATVHVVQRNSLSFYCPDDLFVRLLWLPASGCAPLLRWMACSPFLSLLKQFLPLCAGRNRHFAFLTFATDEDVSTSFLQWASA